MVLYNYTTSGRVAWACLSANLALTGLPRQRVCGPRGLVGGFWGWVIRRQVCGSSAGGGISCIRRPGAIRARCPDPRGRLMGAWFSRSSSGKSWRGVWRSGGRGAFGATFSGVSLIGEHVSSSSQTGDWSNSSRVRPHDFSSGAFLGVSGCS